MSGSGATGADAICAARASTDAAVLPATHTNHKAMLARGASIHPRDLAIPNKANIDVRRPDTAKTQIATTYAKYWDKDYTLAAAVSSSSMPHWTGIYTTATLADTSNTCGFWTVVDGSVGGVKGDASETDNKRWQSSFKVCRPSALERLLCASHK